MANPIPSPRTAPPAPTTIPAPAATPATSAAEQGNTPPSSPYSCPQTLLAYLSTIRIPDMNPHTRTDQRTPTGRLTASPEALYIWQPDLDWDVILVQREGRPIHCAETTLYTSDPYHIDPHMLPSLQGLRGIHTAGFLRLHTRRRCREDK